MFCESSPEIRIHWSYFCECSPEIRIHWSYFCECSPEIRIHWSRVSSISDVRAPLMTAYLPGGDWPFMTQPKVRSSNNDATRNVMPQIILIQNNFERRRYETLKSTMISVPTIGLLGGSEKYYTYSSKTSNIADKTFTFSPVLISNRPH